MAAVGASEFKKAVKSWHSGTAIYVQFLPIHEEFRDDTEFVDKPEF